MEGKGGGGQKYWNLLRKKAAKGEGGVQKNGRHCLWMAPNINPVLTNMMFLQVVR